MNTKWERLECFCECLVLQKALLAIFCSVHFHPSLFTRPVFLGGSGNESTSESCSPAYKLTILGDVENFIFHIIGDFPSFLLASIFNHVFIIKL